MHGDIVELRNQGSARRGDGAADHAGTDWLPSALQFDFREPDEPDLGTRDKQIEGFNERHVATIAVDRRRGAIVRIAAQERRQQRVRAGAGCTGHLRATHNHGACGSAVATTSGSNAARMREGIAAGRTVSRSTQT